MLDNLIYPLLLAIFGGLNILQLIFPRKTQRQVEAKTKGSEIDTQQKASDLFQDQYDYVLKQLTKYQTDYFNLLETVQQSARAHTETIEQKCNEIAELKSKIAYFRGIRCYRCDCSQRIREYVKQDDKQPQQESGTTTEQQEDKK